MTTCQFTVTVVPASPSSRVISRLVVVPVVQGAAAVPSVARTAHRSSASWTVSVERTEVRRKLFVQSTAVSVGAALGVRLVPVKVVVPR